MEELTGRGGEKENSENGSAKPRDTVRDSLAAGAPEHARTIEDARSLWAGAVSADASPSESIKAGGVRARLEAASKVLPEVRRLSKAKVEQEGAVAADFELLKLLGAGAMGVVFSARQESLDREIAVKMMRPDAARDSEARSKFAAEALVTGELDHPNIAPVHDYGQTSEGTLFYAMKQVRGTPWDNVIWDKPLDENLRILLSVCNAVAFAHDKGVIHRDLKPENVMLGDYGEVLVMDWGLAASSGSDKAERLTPESGFAGTPCYMAPEMASCEFSQIGPWSDIYVLGGILYEIVTGLRPHTGEDVYGCIHAAMENVIQPTEKKGELVEIALKAMVTDPADRYASVKDFQRAVREYVSHAESLKLSSVAEWRLACLKEVAKEQVYTECSEVIAAYQQAIELWGDNEAGVLGLRKARETLVEIALERRDLALAQSQVTAMGDESGRLRVGDRRLESPKELHERVDAAIARRARREKIAGTIRWGAISLTALLVIVISTAYFITSAARNRAVAAEKKARSEANKSTAINSFLQGMLASVDPAEARGREVTVRELLDHAASGLGDRFAKHREVEAAIRATIGSTYSALGLYRSAETQLSRALNICRRDLGDEHPDTIGALTNLGIALDGQGRLDEAEAVWRKSLEIGRRALGGEHPYVLASMSNLGILLREKGRLEEAESILRQSIEAKRRVLGPLHYDTLSAMHNLGIVLQERGKLDEAEAIHRRTLETRRRTLGEDHPDTLRSMNELALVLEEQGRLNEAEALHRQTLQIKRRVMGEEHPDTLHSMANLGLALRAQGKLDEAESLLRRCLETERRALGEEHPDTLSGMHNLAVILDERGKSDEAEGILRRCLYVRQGRLGEGHPDTLKSMNSLAITLEHLGRLGEAEALRREIVEIQKRLVGDQQQGP